MGTTTPPDRGVHNVEELIRTRVDGDDAGQAGAPAGPVTGPTRPIARPSAAAGVPMSLASTEPSSGSRAAAAAAVDLDPTDRLARALPQELRAGTLVGEYEITGKLGQGGMGVVYGATHPVIGKKAAVKVLRKNLCADVEAIERFIQEARAVNQIGHPNIVDIFAFGTLADERSYLVMELLSGESLQARLRRAPLTRDELCHHADAIARALEAAHDHKIIHRDLKPENVFLHEVRGERPIVKLLDFGIAKLVDTEDNRMERTRTGAMMGTPQYISPEQARGFAIDYRADVYSFGVMLFEMATGRPPFLADSAMDMVAKHLYETPVRASTLVPELPPVLDDLIAAMLSKDPVARPGLTRVRQVLDEVRALPLGDVAFTQPEIPRFAQLSPASSGRFETAPPAMGTPLPGTTATVAPPRRGKARPIVLVLAAAVAVVVGAVVFVAVKSMRDPEPARAGGAAERVQVPPPSTPGSTPAPTPAPVPAPVPAPATAATGPATVIVQLHGPSRGHLLVDGEPPRPGHAWELDLPAGPHILELRSKGYKKWRSSITLVAGERQTVQVTLDPKPAAAGGGTVTPGTEDNPDELIGPRKDR